MPSLGGPFFPFTRLPDTSPDLAHAGGPLVRGLANTRAIRTLVRTGANTRAISLFVIAPANTRVRKTEFMTPRLMKRKSGGGGRPGNTRISALRRAEERASSRSTLISLNLHTLHLQIDRLVAA